MTSAIDICRGSDLGLGEHFATSFNFRYGYLGISMNKNLIVAALIACNFSVMAQGNEPQQNPKTVVLIKKNAEPAAVNNPVDNIKRALGFKDVTQPARAPSMASREKEPVDAILKLPLTSLNIKAQVMPGLGMIPGDVSDMKIKSVRVGTDRNELVYISQTQLNKISTPFDSPQGIDSSGATLKAVGQDLYLQPVNDKPLTVYITDGGTGQSIGLTLVPKANLPAQSIVLQPDAPVSSAQAKAEMEESVPSDYVSRINSTIKQLALGKTPSGFTRSRLPRSLAVNGEILVEPQYKFAGSTYDLFTYKVQSTSAVPIEMKEESFYTEVVRAVAFFPSAMLQHGEETMVYVIADRVKKDQ